jgi:hypothetical protein
MPSQMENCI